MADLSKMSLEDVTALNRLFDQLDRINVAELDKVKEDALSPMDRMVEELKKNKSVTRRVKGAQLKKRIVHSETCSGEAGGCRGNCGSRHWKAAQRKRREYYQSTTKHKRVIKKGELLATGAEGWWEHIRGHWWQKGYEVTLTKEEWIEEVWPALKGRVPVIRRYNTNGPISLENIYVVESGTQKTVLFDGKEEAMRKAGYIL